MIQARHQVPQPTLLSPLPVPLDDLLEQGSVGGCLGQRRRLVGVPKILVTQPDVGNVCQPRQRPDHKHRELEYLVGKGVNSSRLIVKGAGAAQPVASNDTPEGRTLNRRVEIKFVE